MRRFLKFRLATVFFFVALLAVALGWWKDHHDLRRALFLLINAPGEGEETSGEVERDVQAILQADGARDAQGAYRSLFKAAGSASLPRLKLYRHDSIAIQAAWEEVALTVPEEEGPQVYLPDKGKLGQFLGFLEGRTRVKIPQQWRQVVLDGRANRRRSFSAGGLEAWAYHKTRLDDVYAPLDTTLQKQDGRILLRVGHDSAFVPADLFLAHDSLESGCNVSAAIERDRCYVAVHGDWGRQHSLACIDLGSARILWKSEVWGTFCAGGFSGQSIERVAVTVQSGRVVVFGASSDVNVEAFDAKDGTSLFRFSSSY